MVTLKYQERFKTVKGVFDAFTNRNLFELQSRGHFDELVSPLKIGKEANVFLASSGKRYVIVKIYRIQNSDFSGMYNYIKQDPRYESLKKRRREIIFAWVQREYKNLHRSFEKGVKVPKPLALKHNVLIEELIGDEISGEVALPLKDSAPQDVEEFFELLIEQLRLMYHAAGLVHGDLSAFNILNLKMDEGDKPILIDFSQCTLVKSRASLELLKRDVKNLLQYFKKQGLKLDAEEVVARIVKK
ncbi:serine/threonine protein kinase [archaeon]|nr:serine/threonine protein kinase [archaeon]|tara:strand:- start:1910 stop:2641 length:732 start_codon:yes stop_codon:yes gene_type:complete